MNLATARKKLDHQKQQYLAAKQILSQQRGLAQRLVKDISSVQTAQQLVNTAAATVQQKAHKQLSAVVSHSLKMVFGNDAYTFRIEFCKKRGRTEARLLFDRQGLVVDPLTASGGGVVDVAAFALRVACILISKPELNRVILLDEPFKYVSRELQPVIAQLLYQLSKDLGLQIIMTSHLETLISTIKNDSLGKVINMAS